MTSPPATPIGAGTAKVALVAALDRRRAIGRDGGMPWHLPADLRRFRSLTMGKPVLMGRRTAQSIGRALPGRENLVLTRQPSAPFGGQHVVRSVEAAIALAGERDLMVIGGGEIYAMTIERADVLHLTWIDAAVDGADTWFPAIDPSRWQETLRTHHAADARHAYAFDFIDYRRA